MITHIKWSWLYSTNPFFCHNDESVVKKSRSWHRRHLVVRHSESNNSNWKAGWINYFKWSSAPDDWLILILKKIYIRSRGSFSNTKPTIKTFQDYILQHILKGTFRSLKNIFYFWSHAYSHSGLTQTPRILNLQLAILLRNESKP